MQALCDNDGQLLDAEIRIYDMEYAGLFSKQYRQCVDRNDIDMYINI